MEDAAGLRQDRSNAWRLCDSPVTGTFWDIGMDSLTAELTPEPKPFPWTARKLDAARLVAEDFFSDARIAAKVGVDRRQLTRWKANPEFAAKVKDLVTAMGDRSLLFAVARQHRRVKAMDDRWRKMKKVMRERGAAPEMANVPGGQDRLAGTQTQEHRRRGTRPRCRGVRGRYRPVEGNARPGEAGRA